MNVNWLNSVASFLPFITFVNSFIKSLFISLSLCEMSVNLIEFINFITLRASLSRLSAPLCRLAWRAYFIQLKLISWFRLPSFPLLSLCFHLTHFSFVLFKHSYRSVSQLGLIQISLLQFHYISFQLTHHHTIRGHKVSVWIMLIHLNFYTLVLL